MSRVYGEGWVDLQARKRKNGQKIESSALLPIVQVKDVEWRRTLSLGVVDAGAAMCPRYLAERGTIILRGGLSTMQFLGETRIYWGTRDYVSSCRSNIVAQLAKP